MVKYEQAIKIIDDYAFKQKIVSLAPIETLDLVLAQDVYSNINVPSFAKSAMDGYALCQDNDLTTSFRVVDTIYAGDQHNPVLKQNECVKIMTGAPVPKQANLVIVKELATQVGDQVTFSLPKTELNSNICQIGEDIKSKQLLFKANTIISATMISSMVSSGVFKIEVYAKPKILVLTTGDEVINELRALDHGQIYNSNLAFLQCRLLELGFNCKTAHLDDCEVKLNSYIKPQYDLIITTGAVSVGDRDIIRNYTQKHKSQIIFDRVNIMPGGPCIFWQQDQIPIISLAGSPFANFVTFELFARRILAHLSHNENLKLKEQQLLFNDTYTKKIKKTRFIKAHVQNQMVSIPATNHLASSLHEMTMCNCLLRLEQGEHLLQKNSKVTVLKLGRNYE